MEKTNKIHSVLGADEHIVLIGYQEKWKEGIDWYTAHLTIPTYTATKCV